MLRVPGCFVALLFAATLGAAEPVVLQGPQAIGGDSTSDNPSQPPQDSGERAIGTSGISGRVIAADSGLPVPRALVRVSAPELSGSRSVTTDAAGRYDLQQLPAGRYSVSATKNGFITLSYGQSRVFEAVKTLELAAKQTLRNVDISLPRAGVIAGRVVDEFGEPVIDARVVPMRSLFLQGQRRLSPVGHFGTTNDIGEFRISGLAPGRYYVSATLPGSIDPDDVSDDRSGYAPTYYPGTPNLAEASLVSVGLAETVHGIEFSLLPTRTAKISGTAYDAAGWPLGSGMVIVMQNTNGMMNASTGGQIRPDGSFVVSDLAPGQYVLQTPVLPTPGTPLRFSKAIVNVNGSDVTGVVLALAKPSIALGRVVFDSSAGGSLAPSAVQIVTTPAQFEPALDPVSAPAQLNEDFTFQMEVSPSRMMIRPTVSSPDWVLKAVRLNGADVTDSGIDFSTGQPVDGIEIELTNRPPEVSGVVTDSRGDAVKDYSVVLFTQDRDLWTTDARGFSLARPDKDGRYQARSLPPGRYYAVALESVDAGIWRDPEFLESMSRDAVTFTLRDGETTQVDLKLLTPR